jgi:hypothetical protein
MYDKRAATTIDEHPIGPSIAGMLPSSLEVRIESDGDRRMNWDDPRFLEFGLKNLEVGKFVAQPNIAHGQAHRLADAQACTAQEPEQRRENDWSERIVQIWGGRRAN